MKSLINALTVACNSNSSPTSRYMWEYTQARNLLYVKHVARVLHEHRGWLITRDTTLVKNRSNVRGVKKGSASHSTSTGTLRTNIWESNLSNVTSVKRVSPRLRIFTRIKGYTRVRGLTAAMNAKRDLRIVHPFKHINEHTQARNLISAPNATRVSGKRNIWGDTWKLNIVEYDRINVPIAENALGRRRIYRNTKWHTLEKSPFNALSAKSVLEVRQI